MGNYQELYNKIVKELDILENDMIRIREEFYEADRNYNEVREQISGLDAQLQSLEGMRESLPDSKRNRICNITNVLSVINLFVAFILCFYLLTLFNNLYLGVAVYLGGIYTYAFLSGKVFKKIHNILYQKSYNKIVNSQEYQEILKQICDIEETKTPLLAEEIIKEHALEVAEEKYNIQRDEISKRKEFIDYIEKKLNSSEEDIPKTRVSHNKRVRRIDD